MKEIHNPYRPSTTLTSQATGDSSVATRNKVKEKIQGLLIGGAITCSVVFGMSGYLEGSLAATLLGVTIPLVVLVFVSIRLWRSSLGMDEVAGDRSQSAREVHGR